jgi:hypothetical protein
MDSLAAAYAEMGDFEQAVKFQKKVLEMTKPSNGNYKGMEKRLGLYQEHKPYREHPNQPD